MDKPLKGQIIIFEGNAFKYNGGDPAKDESYEHIPYGPKTMGQSMSEELATRGPLTKLWAGGMGAMDEAAYGLKGLVTDLSPEDKERLEAGKGTRQSGWGKAGAIGTKIAMTAPAYMAGGAALNLPALATAGPLARDALLIGTMGTIGGGLGYATNPDSRIRGALTEGLGAALGAGMGTMARGPFSPIAGSTADVLQKQGIPLTVGQASGMRTLEDKLRGASATTAERQIEAQHAWGQKKVQDTMPPTGQSVTGLPLQAPITGKGRDAIKEGAEAFDDAYQAAYGRMGLVKLDVPTESAIHKIVQSNQTPLLKPSDATALQEEANRVVAEFAKGDLHGRAVRDVIHSLDEPAKTAFNAGNSRLGNAYRAIQEELTLAGAKQFPAAGEALAKIDPKYAEFLRVQRAASAPGNAGGAFTPGQLISAIRALDKSKDKRAFARGTAMPSLLKEAEQANQVLGPTIPPIGPGTAEKMIPVLAAGNWKTAIPSAVGFGLYQRPLQKAMTGQYGWQQGIDPTWYAALTAAMAEQAAQKRPR